MKISTVTHAEIAYDLRGPEDRREYYKTIRNMMKWNEEKQTYVMMANSYQERLLLTIIEQDENAQHHCMAIKRHEERNGKFYYIPKDFTQALSKIDKDIPIEYLPEEFYGYFEFGDGALADDSGPVTSAYVFIGKVKNIVGGAYTVVNNTQLNEDQMVISINYNNKNGAVTKFMWPLSKEKISSLFKKSSHNENENILSIFNGSKVNRDLRLPTIIACLNAVLYVCSDDPELMALLPEKNLKGKQRVLQRSKTNVKNMCALDLILVNHSFKEQLRQRHLDKTWVNPHLRWQPFGEGRGKVKLIWVKGHERSYK